VDIRHDPERHRFAIVAGPGAQGAFLDYQPLGDGVWDLTYTFVPRPDRGGGVGRALVRHVLDEARSRGLRVVPSCGFVATVIAESPEYKDLLSGRTER